MRRSSLACVLLLLVASTSVAADAPTPRAVIERAIKAHGGKEVLGRQVAHHVRMDGKIRPPGCLDEGSVQVDLYRSPGVGAKYVTRGNVPGSSWESIEVHRGEKGWLRRDGIITDLSDDDREHHRQAAYVARMANLTHLLDEKGFTLQALPDDPFDSRPASVIEVSREGYPDVRLSFDKGTGFLVKTAYRPTPGSGKGPLQEVVFGDFRGPGDPTSDEKAMGAGGITTEPKALLAYLREQAPDPEAAEKARKFVAQLGADEFADREQAQKGLIALGKGALPTLQKAAASRDAEVARRARECLKTIKVGDGGGTLRAAVRLLARKAAPGTARALLDVLPGVEDSVAEEILAALAHLAERKGPEAKALEAALGDRDPVKRAAAEAALGKDGGKYLARPGRRLYLAGFKYPMKQTYYQDGKKVLEGRIVQLDFYNALDEKVFAKPE